MQKQKTRNITMSIFIVMVNSMDLVLSILTGRGADASPIPADLVDK